jgi:ankyrin repeat protein
MNTQAIFESIREGDVERVRQLLDERPFLIHVENTEKEAWRERKVMNCAAHNGHLDIVKLLVERGAEVYSHPFANYPPVIDAAWAGHQDVVDYFLNEIPDRAAGTNGIGVAINLAAREGWTDIVRKHIEKDPLSVHQRGWIGDTPLHWPSHNGHVEIVEMLLDAGADIEADEVTWSGGKPLHWASEHEPSTVEVLLKRGAEVNSRNVMKGSDFEGVTPLIMNATQKNDCAEVTELLIEAGADVQAKDAQGKTALQHAEERKLKRIPEVLRAHGATA